MNQFTRGTSLVRRSSKATTFCLSLYLRESSLSNLRASLFTCRGVTTTTWCLNRSALETLDTPHDAYRQRTTRKLPRDSGSVKSSLRRVAVEAERSRGSFGSNIAGKAALQNESGVKIVTARCAAEQYDILHVAAILKGVGYAIDPSHTGLYPQVLHVRDPNRNPTAMENGPSCGDIFIFPSGTVISWDANEKTVANLVSNVIRPAAEGHLDKQETEDLNYVEDPASDKSRVVGDVIQLGTKVNTRVISDELLSNSALGPGADCSDTDHQLLHQHGANLILAKIAFSSGLAKSVKLAVLEGSLEAYFASTRTIPHMMASGERLPFTRRFILRKTGELLNARSQLNLNSELTDSLPDMFWESRHELGLEDYFDQVGRALDVNVRSRILNQKMDYAQEIVSVLREQLSERHSLKLEWLIIILIFIEVMFEIHRLVKNYLEETKEDKEGSVLRDPAL